MTALRTTLLIVIGVTLSALVTMRLQRPKIDVAPRSAVEAVRAAPALPAAAVSSATAVAAPVAPVRREPAEPPTPIRDIGWLLVAQIPGPIYRPAISARIEAAHEQILQMPDDPQWSRKTESALRSALATVPRDNFEFTVACRAGGCEVQGTLIDPMATTGRWPELPPAFSEARPLPDLSMDVTERAPLGDRFGVFFFYRRVE